MIKVNLYQMKILNKIHDIKKHIVKFVQYSF